MLLSIGSFRYVSVVLLSLRNQVLLDLQFTDVVRVGSVRKIAKPVLPFSTHGGAHSDKQVLFCEATSLKR